MRHRLSVLVVLTAIGASALAGSGLKIYVDELDPPLLTRVTYGYDVQAVCEEDFTKSCTTDDECDKGLCTANVCERDNSIACGVDADCQFGVCGVTVSAVAAGSPTTIWDLICDPGGGGACQATSWDFSAVTTTNFPGVVEIGSSVVPVDATETCSNAECGFTQAQARLGREDRNFDQSLGGFFCDDGTTSCTLDSDCVDIGSGLCRRTGTCDDGTTICTERVCSNDTTLTCIDDLDCGGGTCANDCAGIGTENCNILNITLNVTEKQDAVKMCSDDGSLCSGDGDCTPATCVEGSNIWLRAAIRNELETGALGEGESRLCYVGGGRTEVPLFRFVHQDGQGNYMQDGDSWMVNFDCDQNIFNHRCGDPCGPVTCEISANPCSGNCGEGANQNFGAKQESTVVNEGKITLPSGHTFDALVIRQNAEFCAYTNLISGCFFAPQPVRTVLYLFEVPKLGTVARLMSTQLACDTQSFEFLSETDIKFGLFPPKSISVDGVTETTVQLSWDPGAITSRIGSSSGNYRVYWDTNSGDVDSYAFNSSTHPGSASIVGTTATISGLTTGVEYFFTVTVLSDYTDPATCLYDNCASTEYESLLFPKQVTGGPVPIPQEVAATPASGSNAGAVPDGRSVPGLPLTLSQPGGGMLDLSWSASCVGSDTDYEVYEGAIGGNFTSHTQVVCTTGGSTVTQIAASIGDRYYLVVPHNGSAEGSYGRDSSGVERAASAAPCRSQSVGSPVCP